MTMSGTRLTKDRASAASGGMPNNAPSAINPPSWIPNPLGTGKAAARSA